jgi:AraC-like DNA-binding protein
LSRTLNSRLVDAVVVAPQPPLLDLVHLMRVQFPALPVLAFAPFRPADGPLMQACREARFAAVLVEGVDNAVVGDLVIRLSAAAERRAALADAPRVLRLADPLQREVWNYLLERVDKPLRTQALAHRFRRSREHLSREFAAGGAPNLKRAIDLTRVACAAQLLQNPGYDAGAVARLLNFASSSHLNSAARRIANVPTRGLSALGPRGVLAAFVRGNTRSRLG